MKFETKYNVGDKVKVKSWNRIKEECGLTIWGYASGTPFNHEVDLMGKTATIKEITKVGVVFEEDAHEYEYPLYLIENKVVEDE